MKSRLLKVMAIGLSAAMMFSMTGCSSSDSGSSDSDTSVNYSVNLNDDGTLEDVDPADYVTLPEDYNNITIPAYDVEVTDDELQSSIDEILADYTEDSQVTDRAIVDGDTVNIDYVGRIDGVEFENGSTDGAGTDVTIGETEYIDDFLEQLIGHTPGETFDVNVTFPDDYSDSSVAGKDAVFETTINYITEEVTPELTDEFVAENLEESEGYTSVEDMKTKLTEDLVNEKKQNNVWSYILDESEFKDLPEEMIDDQVDLRVAVLESQAEAYGYTFDEVIEMQGYEDEDEMRESMRTDCEDLLKEYFALQLIYENEGLEIEEEDLIEFFGTSDITQYTDTYGEGYINRIVMDNKVIDYLVENSTVDETAVEDPDASTDSTDSSADSAE